MKSIGPDAYTNDDHPTQKPVPLSLVIGEVMSQVGTQAKSTPGAPMQEKQAPKRPNSSDKSPESKAQQPSPSGTRSPGRPPKMRIDSINIPTDLELDERFIEFRELTGATEAQALLSIFALYKYAARHRAADADLKNIKPELLAKRCYWRDCSAEIFLEALVEAEILTPNLKIADWHETQPHAIKRAHNIKHYQKQRDKEFQ